MATGFPGEKKSREQKSQVIKTADAAYAGAGAGEP
jgi:hypothetical protein